MGYNTVSAPVGFNIFPVQFKNVAAKDNSVDLLTLLSGTYDPVTTAQANRGMGTQIWVLNSRGGYDKYYYLSDAYDEETDDDAIGWGNAGGDLVESAPATLGDSFWLVNGTDAANTFICAGEVSGSNTESISLAEGFQLAANPYPVNVAFEDITWSSLSPVTTAQANRGMGTQIWVLNSRGGYDKYYYLSDAYDEETDDDAIGWGNAGGDLVSGQFVTAGQGFWIVAPGEGTATFGK